MSNYVINGVVEIAGIRFWRISHLWRTVALVPVNCEDADRGKQQAQAIINALNGAEFHAAMEGGAMKKAGES